MSSKWWSLDDKSATKWLAKEKRRTARAAKRKIKKVGVKAKSDRFLASAEWARLRYYALVLHGSRCMCCGRTPNDGAKMNVDHVLPRSKYPKLALDIHNLQVLCNTCNWGKGNRDTTDFRSLDVDTRDELTKEFSNIVGGPMRLQ